MKKYHKNNLNNIPLEEAHGGSGKRQLLVKPEHLLSGKFEAMTKGYLNPGFSFDWHTHKDTDEIFIVLQGEGKFFWEEEVVSYNKDDVFVTPANSNHKITAEGDLPSEFYFVRIKL